MDEFYEKLFTYCVCGFGDVFSVATGMYFVRVWGILCVGSWMYFVLV